MFEKYGLKDCGPEIFNVLKQKEKDYMQRLAEKERKKNEIKQRAEDTQSKKENIKNEENNVEQIQESNIENGGKSSNLSKWLAIAGVTLVEEELIRGFLFNGDNPDE